MPIDALSSEPVPSVRAAAADATRARILAAARIEFVTEGLNGARVDRIAERAHTNKNLIYHHNNHQHHTHPWISCIAWMSKIFYNYHSKPS